MHRSQQMLRTVHTYVGCVCRSIIECLFVDWLEVLSWWKQILGMYFCDRSAVQLSPQSHLWTQTFTCSQGPCEACRSALESLHTLCNTQTCINKHTCTCTGMKLCACSHVPQQALNKQTAFRDPLRSENTLPCWNWHMRSKWNRKKVFWCL